MRSIFGRERVTQTVPPLAFCPGRAETGTSGRPSASQASSPPSRISASAPAFLKKAATPSDSSSPFLQATTTQRSRYSARPLRDVGMATPMRGRKKERVRGEIVVVAHVDDDRPLGGSDQA